MQKSPEFAKELLRALRGRRRRWTKAKMTKRELHGYWCRMTDPSYHSKINIFFDMYIYIFHASQHIKLMMS